MGILSLIVAGILSLASQAGQSVQQWINSPQGQQQLRNVAQTIGPNLFQELERLLKKYL